ncbi:pantoate--beta-alanine ligase [Evansella sp. AB-P1]|uniref:pantoate--beta-alanine ligase n=1 Tax=Evansella sp. AB-P1 TaxID=3037653 RepID=UPI00241F7F72|nr:pantoate--beta-alanine ligase [Evansella sp. AB-P1]MDG5787565.1 pantoate--beta-alanine ligase [Evansella sp. AB-P1]
MEIITDIFSMKNWIMEAKLQGKKIGFVPTMGFLHEGHLSLIKQANKENDIVVLSIFVNPLQFGAGEDFERYPKNKIGDEQLAKDNGVHVLFCPTVDEMYPTPMSATFVVHEGVDVLCGANRPGHFDGVATVVMKLFGIMTPDRAYFGLKDAQQVAVIERLVKDYHLDITIVRGATVREQDGLAKSSRNVNLTEDERKEAPLIYQTLVEMKKLLLEKKRNNTVEIEALIMEKLRKRLSGSIDYCEIRSFPSLKKLEIIEGEMIIAVAVRYSKARLIDNIMFNISEEL